jgi:glycine hydroxymethyltransferase
VNNRAQIGKSSIPPKLKKLLRKHEKWRLESCLNLIVSENFTSPAVRKMLSCDLTNRYTAPDKFYMGTRYTDEIQAETENLAKKNLRRQVCGC